MTTLNTELLVALYAIYANDCVHWVDSGAFGFTRASIFEWRSHSVSQFAFTLLGRRPLLVDPFLLLPGYVCVTSKNRISDAATKRSLRKISIVLDRRWLLEAQCRVQAILLLLFFPWSIWTGRLSLLWRSMAVALFLSHGLLLITFLFALRRHNIKRPFACVAPILINPLGAIRAQDLLSQLVFNTVSEKMEGIESNSKTVN